LTAISLFAGALQLLGYFIASMRADCFYEYGKIVKISINHNSKHIDPDMAVHINRFGR